MAVVGENTVHENDILNDLSYLMNGIKLNSQHPYFNMAKKDIMLLALQFYNHEHFNENKYLLVNHIRIIEKDIHNLKIVLKYVETYGLKYFQECLKSLTNQLFDERDYSQYLYEYIELIKNCIKN